MKALVLQGPGNFKYEEDWPKPEPKEGWALIKVKYCGICGSDLPRMMITGSYDHPKICGHEFMGEIEKPASGSGRFKKGDSVAVLPLIPCKKCPACLKKEFFHCKSYNFLGSRTHGGFAEYCSTPEENLFLLPNNIDKKIGAFVEPLSVSLHVIRQSGFKTGESVLIFGAGTIGLLTAMWLNIMGAGKIVIASRSDNSLETARKAGFKEVIKINSENFKEFYEFDHCFEAAGANEALIQAIEKIKHKGTITVVGRDTKELHLSLKVFEQIMRKEIILKGCWGYDNKNEDDFIYHSIKSNKFNIAPLITKVINLSKGEEQIKKMFNKEEYYCRVLFEI